MQGQTGSDYAQIVALNVRSLARQGEAPLQAHEEMDYAVTINRALPDDIRVLGWAPLPDQDFSARYSPSEIAFRSLTSQTLPVSIGLYSFSPGLPSSSHEHITSAMARNRSDIRCLHKQSQSHADAHAEMEP